MIKEHVLISVAWVVYCVVHSVLANARVKEKMARWMKGGFRYYRIGYNIFASVTLQVIIYYQIRMDSPALYANTLFFKILGGTIALSGLLLMIVCIRKYFAELSGIRNIKNEAVTDTLIVTGVHTYVRHPLYLGTFAFVWGLFLIFPYVSFFITNGIITIYTLIGIYMEEEKLEAVFGESYKQYKLTVPKLIPFTKK